MLLPLVGLFLLATATAGAIAVLCLILSAFMPFRRALLLAAATIAGGLFGALAGAMIIAWLGGFSGETLTTGAEVVSFHAGVGLSAAGCGVAAAWAAARVFR